MSYKPSSDPNSPQRFCLSVNITSSLPPHPTTFTLLDENNEPLSAIIYLPPPDLTTLRSGADVVIGKKASKSKKTKAVSMGGRPWMGGKQVRAGWKAGAKRQSKLELHTNNFPLVASLLPSRPSPVVAFVSAPYSSNH